jgi:hypothetical protein
VTRGGWLDPDVHRAGERARFALAYVALVQAYNLVDLNTGLCLAHLRASSSEDVRFPRSLGTAGMTRRLGRLARVVKAQLSANAQAEFAIWAAEADAARALRNHYVHAIWSWLPAAERPLHYELPPWVLDDEERRVSGHRSVAEFERDTHAIEAIRDRFLAWRKRHGV